MTYRAFLILPASVVIACLGGETALPLGAACDESSPCQEGLICLYGRCRSPCLVDADCDDDEICVPSQADQSVLACTLPDETCDDGQPCPPGFFCDLETGRCRGVAAPFEDQTVWGQGTWHDDRHVVDLTSTDVALTYTLDLTAVVVAYEFPHDASVMVGMHEIGAEDIHPGPWDQYQGGAGGWMASLVRDLQSNDENLNLNDKHFLAASGYRSENDYDVLEPNSVEDTFFGSHDNFGIWFDRDGVDPYQPDLWGWEEGGNYLTGGIYHVEISYHAISGALGTMMSSVNGIHPGFYADGFHEGPPDYYPAGLSFTGDMSRMQLFIGNCAPDDSQGPITVSDIDITATPRGD